MEKRPFTDFDLTAETLKAVHKMGFEEASPIQTAALPVALAGKDLVGQSATGSGKTAAFAIPAIEKIDAHRREVQALILCPTRELAVQVAEEFAKLAQFKRGLHVVPIYGGQSYDRQFRALAAGVQVIIGTPGRVIDHLERGTLKLNALRIAILDEADRMLDMGFRDDIERILSATPESRQTLFFSATMPRAIQQLINTYTRDPQWVKIESHAQHAPKVDQVYFEVERRSKLEVLTRVIDLHDFRAGIVFCSTKIMVDELAQHLHARGYNVDRLHGDLSQAQRNRVMERFRERKFEFLIATDVAARGLDVEDLEVVFNFDLPNDGEDYTHRIGRTGRAGKSGRAFTFVSGRELYKLQSMVRFAKLKIRRETIPSLEQVEQARGNVFFERVRALLEKGNYPRQDGWIDRLLEQGFASTDILSAALHLANGGGEPEIPPAPPAARHKKVDTEAPREDAPRSVPRSRPAPSAPDEGGHRQGKYERPARTGREAGMTPLFFNIGRKQLVTPADIVGKIAGVTRLPAAIVGAIDIHQRHTLVDVADEHATRVIEKLSGIRVKGETLKVALAESMTESGGE